MKLNFETAVQQQRAEEEGEGSELLELHIGSNVFEDKVASDHTYWQKAPSPALLSVVMAGVTQNTTDAQKSEALWDYFRGTLERVDYLHLRNRIIDTGDIDLDRLLEVFQKSASFWSTFPTKPSSDSAGSPPSIGMQSTGRAPGAGSSRFTSPPLGS